ncbi:L,D-transpeptidase family protein [Microvirga roseola]|uniref:L,D-transpeptidase family protein n=1 Tax=Microvirga roseola TaxID=2883126 RepID=UPI001E4D0F7C|nr:L,D-transpeptidase family protein [Microvirga roseola]
MRDWRRKTLWLGLIGSVSFMPLAALAESGPVPAAPAEPVILEPAEPSFDDAMVDLAPARQEPRPDVIPLTEPAPVTINAADLKPAGSLDIPLPETAPVAVVTRSDWDRIAIDRLFSDEAAMRQLRLEGREREALAAFYGQAERPLIWLQGETWSAAALSAMKRVKAADEDGLNPEDYPLPPAALSRNATPAERAEADVRLSLAIARYAQDARGARIDLARLSPLVTPKLDVPGTGDVLKTVASAADANAALASYHPPHPGYGALRAELAKLRAERPTRLMVRVPKGPTLRVGMKDPRVPLIRARFNLAKDADSHNVYDRQLASAVAAFQKEKGLPTNGALTPQTVAALSGPSPAQREAELISNMERWRWLPADLGARHIAVNVPEFRLRLVEAGDVVHETRVIVGKKESQTPIFSENMKYLVVNPSWTIPPSIMKKEILPALASDPTYAERKGYQVIRNGNRITVRQPPGARNALGYVKFMFPNQHAVYLHDTPNRNLFSAAKRAFSHGCVRVDKPFELAEAIMGANGKWSEKKLRGLIGKGERYVHLSNPLPVHLTYFTLSVDEKGSLTFFEDLYGLDRKVRAALNLPG